MSYHLFLYIISEYNSISLAKQSGFSKNVSNDGSADVSSRNWIDMNRFDIIRLLSPLIELIVITFVQISYHSQFNFESNLLWIRIEMSEYLIQLLSFRIIKDDVTSHQDVLLNDIWYSTNLLKNVKIDHWYMHRNIHNSCRIDQIIDLPVCFWRTIELYCHKWFESLTYIVAF